MKVFDRATGNEVTMVVEVNAAEGWLYRYTDKPEVCTGEPKCAFCDGNKPGDHAKAERLEGDFEIRRVE